MTSLDGRIRDTGSIHVTGTKNLSFMGERALFSWEDYYSRLFNEAMDRATQATERSVADGYLEQAKGWLERLERTALKGK